MGTKLTNVPLATKMANGLLDCIGKNADKKLKEVTALVRPLEGTGPSFIW